MGPRLGQHQAAENLLSNSTEAFESLVDCGLHFYNYVEYTGDPQYGESLKWAPCTTSWKWAKSASSPS